MNMKDIKELKKEYIEEKTRGCSIYCLSYVRDTDGEKVSIEKITAEGLYYRVKSCLFYKNAFNARVRVESLALTDLTPYSLSIKSEHGIIKERYYIIKENSKDDEKFQRMGSEDAEAMAWSLWGVRVKGGLLS